MGGAPSGFKHFSVKMRAFGVAIFIPGGEQKLLMELFCKLYSDGSKDMKIYLLLWILVKNFCSISNRVPIEKAEDKQTPLV